MAKVRALQWHTGFGETHEVGDVYDAPDDHVESLRVQGKAVLVEADAPAPAQPSQPVDVMTTEDLKP